MQEQISQSNHDLLGCDGWEISAHAGSAPDHEPYQGKQYPDKEYQRLNNSLVRRIGTLNCGHAASPIILGVNDPQYTPEELEQFRRENEEGVTYEGKHYTLYEATQRQRKFESSIRKQKRRILVDESTGDQEKLQADQIKLVRLREEYARFSKGTGLPMQHARMETAGFDWKTIKAVENAAKAAEHGEDISQVFKTNNSYRTNNGEFDLEEAKKDYRQFLTTTPKKNRMLLEQSFGSVEFEQRKLETAPFGYSSSQDKVLYDPTRSDFWNLDFTVVQTHELAHRIDSFFVQSAENADFSAAIANSAKIIEADPQKFVEYCRQNDEHGFLSDIFSAISGGKHRFVAGHETAYWEESGRKEREVFANLFSLEAFQDKQKLEFLRDNFPELIEAFGNLEY